MKALLAVLGGLAVLLPGRAAECTLAVDKAHSRVEVAVKATVDSFTATLSDFDATLAVDPAAGRITSAVFTFRFADLFTGKKDRDHEMLVWEDAEHFPDGRFELTALDPVPAGGYVARGRLRLHGVDRLLEFPVSVTGDGRTYAIDGNVKLDTRDFGLEVIRKLLLLKVDPQVQVRFHLQGVVASL
jgi:polyisoprenoid-binding protein YceI